MSEAAGARVSKGTNAESVDEMMAGLTAATLNFATFTTIEEPTIEDKLALAKWSNLQNERFLYVGWGKEAAALQAGNTTSFGAKLKESQYSGATAVYGGLDKAAFLCGAIASIDFSEREGRITVAFKGQSGLEVDVTDATEAQNLKDNGYNFYGAWATANDRFLFMYPGQMTGKWRWMDSYVNQIRLNSQLQLALMTMLTSAKSVPYNAVGRALHRAACQDAIDEALNFGSIRAGVDLSEQQRAIINNEAGVDAATQIEARGYIQHEHQLTITFEANSPTRAHFAKMYERMTEQMETFPFEFQVDIPSLGIRRIAKGFMINLAGFSAKKRMDAGSFTFNLGVVTEEEIS